MQFRETNLKRALKNCFLQRKKKVYVIEQHLGLGDHLICIALIRELVRESDHSFYLACLPQNYHSVTWMFKDLNNLFVFCVSSGREARQYSGFLNAQLLQIGVNNVDVHRFDAFFYEQHRLPFDLRWENAQVLPGPNSDKLYDDLVPTHEPYILVCDSSSSGKSPQLKINNPAHLKVIHVFPATNNIFDWTKLILNATEIHSIDTSFMHLVENLMYKRATIPLFYHMTRKTIGHFSRRQPWQEINYSDKELNV
jgi:hypothetical protein